MAGNRGRSRGRQAVFNVLRDAACEGLMVVDAAEYQRDQAELDRLRGSGRKPRWSSPFSASEPGVY